MTALDKSDILVRHMSLVPAHRALIRSLEHRLFAGKTLAHPVLDIGCGDGHFAAVAFDDRIDVGLDPGESITRAARRNGPYCCVNVASAVALPYVAGIFHTVIANCVIEHIPDIESALREIARVLAPGGRFIFTVPNARFTEMLFTVSTLRQIGLSRIAEWYGRWWNKRAAHYHLDGPEVWRARLVRNGLTVDACLSYMSPGATRAFELAHYYAIPSLAYRWLTGRWVLRPARVQSSFAYRWLKPYSDEPWPSDGSCSYFISHK